MILCSSSSICSTTTLWLYTVRAVPLLGFSLPLELGVPLDLEQENRQLLDEDAHEIARLPVCKELIEKA